MDFAAEISANGLSRGAPNPIDFMLLFLII